MNKEKFYAEWGIDSKYLGRGGVTEAKPQMPDRKVTLLQRKTSKVGDGLGKTTGWIHRTSLKNRGVNMMAGVVYQRVDDAGLHVLVDGQSVLIEADTVVLCTGQDPLRALVPALEAAGRTFYLIGGADVAAELDAKRAIRQGAELAAAI